MTQTPRYPQRPVVPEIVVPNAPAAGTELVASLPPGQAERRFRLLARLGGGKYSAVWQAAPVDEPGLPEVAVKVMAPGLSDDERTAFMDEVVRLNSLASHGRKSGLQRDDEEPLVPRVLGYSHKPVAFFAMTLARGRPLDTLLRENGEQSALPEVDVLRLGEQLCRAFRLLHEGLRRSYLDFQPGNVFWDEEGQHAMVVDWNLLSPEGKADVAADVQGVAQLLYRLAIGRAPQAGRLEEPAGWRALTSGLRELLWDVLRPLPRWCYTDMAGLHQRVAQLLGWWSQEPGELMARMTELAPKPTPEAGEEQETSYRAALHVLDIAQARGAEPWLVETMREQVRTYLGEAGSLGRGRKAYLSGDVAAARDAFKRVREQTMSPAERLAAWRWEEAVTVAHRNRLAGAGVVDVLANWTAAWAKGERADPGPDKPPSGDLPLSLDREWQAWRSLWQAVNSGTDDSVAYDEASCQVAADGYQAALQLARLLPYGKLLLKLWESVPAEAERLKARAEALASEQRRIQAIQDAFNRGALAGIDALRRELNSTPGDERLTELGLLQARAWRDQGEVDYARRLLGGITVAAAPRLLGEVVTLRQEISAIVVLRVNVAPPLRPAQTTGEPSWTEAHKRLAEVEQILKTAQRSKGSTSAPSPVLTEEERREFRARLDTLVALVQAQQPGEGVDAERNVEPPAPTSVERNAETPHEPAEAGGTPLERGTLRASECTETSPTGGGELQVAPDTPSPLQQDSAQKLHEQIESLRAQATGLIESGLVNDIEPAISRLMEALAISEVLDDAAVAMAVAGGTASLTGELRQALNDYGEIQKQVGGCLRAFEDHKHARRWEAAAVQLKHGVTIFRSLSGQPLIGWEAPGEVEAEVEFLEHLERFRSLYKQLKREALRGNDQHKAPLLQDMGQALQQMRALRDKLRPGSRKLLDEQEQRYAMHRMEPSQKKGVQE